MQLEHSVEMIIVDDNMKSKLETLQREGWQLVPGVVPVAVYHLVRVKVEEAEAAAAGALGKLRVDDSLITVIPAAQRN